MNKIMRHFFIPHESNNHRAKLLHIDSIVIIISLIFLVFSFMTAVQSRYPAVLGISYNITSSDLLDVTNKIRLERGLSQLRLNPQLSQAASEKAQDMFTKNYWAHIAPDGVTPWSFIKNSGYDYLYAGENLARGFTKSADIVNAWMASPTHRENMLSSNYTDVGFAIVLGSLTGSETILVVEELGTRFDQKPLAVSESPPPSSQAALIAELIASPSPVTAQSPQILSDGKVEVAAISQQPLFDKNDITKNTIITIILAFILVLIIDAVIIERKKIIRTFSHNIDHIIYLLIILFTIIIISKGIIL